MIIKNILSGDMRESAERRVSISGIQANIMKQLIDYAYTANITITHDNAQQLLSAANLVQIHSIREACCKFLEKEMDPSNCLGIHCFAEAHVCLKLSEKAKKFAEEHFTEVAHHEEILLLPQNKMIELISSDDLVVMTEEIVLDAVINWVKHEPESRGKHLAEVMQHVRLPLVSPYFLFDKIETESILSRFTECRALFDEAMKYFILKVHEYNILRWFLFNCFMIFRSNTSCHRNSHYFSLYHLCKTQCWPMLIYFQSK